MILSLKDVLYCSEIGVNLISISKLSKDNITVSFEGNTAVLLKNNKIIETAKK